MKITCLIENTPGHPLCFFEHGLSLYAETENHRIIFDAGQTDASMKNSEILGIDVKGVDSLFLSHGHYDHSGGIEKFAEINSTALIYAQKTALLPCWHGERYIGVGDKFKTLRNLVLLDGNLKIDNELSVFSGISGRRLFPKGNLELEREAGGIRMKDDFRHEQCLVISEKGRNILLSGCAHSGILNILDRYNELFGTDPDIVISGFHMMKSTEYTDEDIEIIKDTAYELMKKNTLYYSGHCTGQAAFDIMKNIMGDRLSALHSGESVIEI